jgi:hypothetical protein
MAAWKVPQLFSENVILNTGCDSGFRLGLASRAKAGPRCVDHGKYTSPAVLLFMWVLLWDRALCSIIGEVAAAASNSKRLSV